MIKEKYTEDGLFALRSVLDSGFVTFIKIDKDVIRYKQTEEKLDDVEKFKQEVIVAQIDNVLRDSKLSLEVDYVLGDIFSVRAFEEKQKVEEKKEAPKSTRPRKSRRK